LRKARDERGLCVERSLDQRFDMYMVISMPNRRSMAVGVSQVIALSYPIEFIKTGHRSAPAAPDETIRRPKILALRADAHKVRIMKPAS
jgi:hypothetical protein